MAGAGGTSGRRARHLAIGAAGALGGAMLVALVFFSVEWRGGPSLAPRFDLLAFARRLPEHGRWLLPYALLTATLPALRALVWRAAAPPPLAFPDAYHATALGALVHNAVPGKLGPAAAAALLGRFTGRPFAAALSSQLVAKLLELAGLVTLAGVAAGARGGQAAGTRAALVGAAAVAALAALAAALARGGPVLAARLAPARPRLGAFVGAAAEGVRGVGSPARLARAAAAGLLPPLVAACAYALPLRAFGVGAPLEGGALLLATVTFGQLTPGLPVGTGVYYALAAWIARRLGAAPADAAALAVLTHATTVATMLLVGAASAVVRRSALIPLAGVLRARRAVARARRRSAGGAPSDARSRTPT